MIHDPIFETMPREQLRALQSDRLRILAAYVYERVPFYRQRFDEAGIGPSDVRSLEDLPKFPFTVKSDLRDHYPFGLFAVPQNELARVHASSGTTGRPTVVGYTRADIEVFAEVNARSLAMAGAEPGLIAAQRLRLRALYRGPRAALRGGAPRHDRSADLRRHDRAAAPRDRRLPADVIACTPSYALTLAQEFEKRGVSPEEISLRFAVVGAEPWTESMRTAIDAGLGVRAANIYGLSEIIGPGVSCECQEERAGSHINEDHFLPEVVDPETREPLPEGAVGVLVFTTLTKQAMPLVRYWTGDLPSISSEPCSCGRTLVRMASITGRTDDMLIIRGVNVFPTQVEEVLGRVEELSPHYQLVVSRDGTLDELEVRAEVTDEFFRSVGIELLSDEAIEADHTLRGVRERVAYLIKDTIGCTMQVTLTAPGELPRSEGGKLTRVDDRRPRD